MDLPELVFNEGSDHAFIDLDFRKMAFEGIEQGILLLIESSSQKNVISDWCNSNVEILINDLDSIHDGSGNNQNEDKFGTAE